MKKSGLSVPADESACNGVVGRRITTGRETLNQTRIDNGFLGYFSCDQLDATRGFMSSRLVPTQGQRFWYGLPTHPRSSVFKFVLHVTWKDKFRINLSRLFMRML